jgi:hypothetical protein
MRKNPSSGGVAPRRSEVRESLLYGAAGLLAVVGPFLIPGVSYVRGAMVMFGIPVGIFVVVMLLAIWKNLFP